jgi:hypothetical protein
VTMLQVASNRACIDAKNYTPFSMWRMLLAW